MLSALKNIPKLPNYLDQRDPNVPKVNAMSKKGKSLGNFLMLRLKKHSILNHKVF